MRTKVTKKRPHYEFNITTRDQISLLLISFIAGFVYGSTQIIIKTIVGA